MNKNMQLIIFLSLTFYTALSITSSFEKETEKEKIEKSDIPNQDQQATMPDEALKESKETKKRMLQKRLSALEASVRELEKQQKELEGFHARAQQREDMLSYLAAKFSQSQPL